MIRSMTGYGAASTHAEGADLHVELRTVNNRYFKVGLRLPEALQGFEAEVEIALRRRISRGSVNVRVTYAESGDAAGPAINKDALRAYVEGLLAAWPEGAPTPSIDPASLLTLPGVLRGAGDESDRHDRLRGAVLPLIDRACDQLLDMRDREGAALAEDLLGLNDEIAQRVRKIEALAPGVATQYAERLRGRIDELLKDRGTAVNEADLVREVAVYAERVDIAEEITRLRTHIEQFEARIREGKSEPIGRILEFLAQEMLREANTIASKSPDASVSTMAVEIKGFVDRIKEQTQNVE